MTRKTFVALTLPAFAILDDREGSDCRVTAIRHCCDTSAAADLLPDITVSLPDDVHRIVREHAEVRWSGIARRAGEDYIKKNVPARRQDPAA
jgi:hypothetical protein